MLTTLHPELLDAIQDFPIGLCVLPPPSYDNRPILVVKALKECILATQLNRNFKIYLPSLGDDTVVSGLVTAFFDDADEPLVLRSPLFDDKHSRRLVSYLQESELDVHLFDEHTRELLAFRCSVAVPEITKQRLRRMPLGPFSYEFAGQTLDCMQKWFGKRGPKDDAEAITIGFEESLMPENIYLMDLTPKNNGFVGARPFNTSYLVRKEPGALQEHDIALLLQRVFPANQIYKSPLRINDREEIADLLVISDTSLIFIQAKDSPNTENALRNLLERKKATARKSLKRALVQTRGAVRYAKSAEPITLLVDGREVKVPIADLAWRALIVVKDGACQVSCRLGHAAKGCLSILLRCSVTTESRSGLSGACQFSFRH